MSKRGINKEVWVRLDRALCSMDWRALYREGFIKYLPRLNSDHCPLLLHLASNHIPVNSLKPFRFEAMWMKHKGFDEVVKDSWVGEENFCNKVRKLAEVLKVWNCEHFGALFLKKKRILARFLRVQRCLSINFNHSIVMLESELRKEYNDIIEQEEVFWLQM
ncbi:hypothetical protein ACOSQ2_031404 [Xanthoceras sorbifolium]